MAHPSLPGDGLDRFGRGLLLFVVEGQPPLQGVSPDQEELAALQVVDTGHAGYPLGLHLLPGRRGLPLAEFGPYSQVELELFGGDGFVRLH
jgi:hypothetical protein